MNLADQLRALEERLIDPAFRKNPNLVAELLSDDFREFGSSGRTYSKAEVLEALRAESTSTPQLRRSLIDFELKPLSDTAALIIYRSSRQLPGKPARESLRCSLWTRRGDRWQLLFHQGTRIPGA
jgi:hypothetical protein